MSAASFSAPLVAGVPSSADMVNVGPTDLVVVSHPQAFRFAPTSTGQTYTYDGSLPAGTDVLVAAHPLIEKRDTTIPLTVTAGAFTPLDYPVILVTGDSNAERGFNAFEWLVRTRNLNADLSGDTGNIQQDGTTPSRFGVGGSQSNPGSNQGLTTPSRMAREKAAIKAYAAKGRKVIVALRHFTNGVDSITDLRTYATTWFNEVPRGGGADRFVLFGALPNKTDVSRNNYHRATNDMLRQFAADNGIDFVDCFEALCDPATGLGDARYFGDSIHLNKTGEYKLAQIAEPVIVPLIAKRAAVPVDTIGAYGSSNPTGNFYGAALRTKLVGGTDRITMGTGTKTGTPPAGLFGDGIFSGDLSIEWTSEDYAVTGAGQALAPGSYRIVWARLTATGTTSISGQSGIGAQLGLTTNFFALDPAVPAGTTIQTRALLVFDNLLGYMGHRVNGQFTGSLSGDGVNVLLNGLWQYTDEPVTLTSPLSGNLRADGFVFLRPNAPISGRISFILPVCRSKVS